MIKYVEKFFKELEIYEDIYNGKSYKESMLYSIKKFLNEKTIDNAEEVYKSGELFDFFRNRILESKRKNPCEELAKTGGVSMIDSFSVEEISEKLSPKYKKIILEAYDLQLRKKQMQESKEIGTTVKASKEDNSDEIPDI